MIKLESQFNFMFCLIHMMEYMFHFMCLVGKSQGIGISHTPSHVGIQITSHFELNNWTFTISYSHWIQNFVKNKYLSRKNAVWRFLLWKINTWTKFFRKSSNENQFLKESRTKWIIVGSLAPVQILVIRFCQHVQQKHTTESPWYESGINSTIKVQKSIWDLRKGAYILTKSLFL